MAKQIGIPSSASTSSVSTLLELGPPPSLWGADHPPRTLRAGNCQNYSSIDLDTSHDDEEGNKEEDLAQAMLILQDEVNSLPTIPSSAPKEEPAPTASTPIGDVAQAFSQVLMNSHKDVHVGMLINAFKVMEDVLRRGRGLGLIANDLAQNIALLEALYRDAPVDLRDSMRALIQYEIDAGVHHGLDPKKDNTVLLLENESGAMGLLWLGRNLMYQYIMFQHLLLDENNSPVQATQMAFRKVLSPHLNWAMSKVVQAAIGALTPKKQCHFFATLGGGGVSSNERCWDCRRDVQQMWNHWGPLFETWNGVFKQFGIEDI